MKHILTICALTAIMFALPNRSNAQVYIDISGGASMLNDLETTETWGGQDYNGTYEFDTGRALYFEVGKKTDNRTLGLLLGITAIHPLKHWRFARPTGGTVSVNYMWNLDSKPLPRKPQRFRRPQRLSPGELPQGVPKK